MGFATTRSSPGSRKHDNGGKRIATGLLLLLAAAASDCWPWGSDPLCPLGPEPQCPSNPVTDFDNYFPHPSDCHYYIQCDVSRKALCRPCAPTTFFSPGILNCVWPLDAKCEHNATTRQDSLLPPICGPDRCETGLKKRDYSDCTHYFMCNGTFEDRRECPAGQHFNTRNNDCDDQCTAGCENPCTIPECQNYCRCDENTPPKVDPYDCTVCEVCRGGKIVKERCPSTTCRTKPCERTKHPEDCQGFFDNCTTAWTRCEDNLHFNPVTQMCEDPCTVGCKPPCEIAGCACPCDENTPPKVDPYDCTVCEVCRGGKIVKERCPLSVKDTCTEIKCCELRRHETDCHLFYNYCSMTWSSCPGDLHFNEVTRTCDHPCRAGCKDRREIGACCPADGEVHEDPCTCDMYYLCTNGIKELVKCEDGLQYNNTLGRCDNSCSGGCPKLFAGNPECCASTSGKPEPQCPSTTYPIFLPHPSSSQFFYKCVNGVRSCIRCPLQRRWNTDTDTCDETACSSPETPFY